MYRIESEGDSSHIQSPVRPEYSGIGNKHVRQTIMWLTDKYHWIVHDVVDRSGIIVERTAVIQPSIPGRFPRCYPLTAPVPKQDIRQGSAKNGLIHIAISQHQTRIDRHPKILSCISQSLTLFHNFRIG